MTPQVRDERDCPSDKREAAPNASRPTSGVALDIREERGDVPAMVPTNRLVAQEPDQPAQDHELRADEKEDKAPHHSPSRSLRKTSPSSAICLSSIAAS